MKCDDVFEVILTRGPLTEEMAEHLEGCEECAGLNEAVVALDKEGDRGRKRDLSAGAVDYVLSEAARITGERISPPHTKMKEWWLVQRLAAAAAVVLAAGLGIMLLSRMLAPEERAAAPVEFAVRDTGTEIDGLREDLTADISGFAGRHYANGGAGQLYHEIADLKSRMEAASAGLQLEFAGL